MQKRKGFTLVELVIVIAVIAILAGVLIGTFASVINRANESARMQELKAQEIEQKAEDILKKIEDSNWYGWEDFEASLVAKMTEAYKKNSGNSITEDTILKVVRKALDEFATSQASQHTSLTEEQVKAIVENAIGGISFSGVTEAQVRAIVGTATSSVLANQLTVSQIRTIVNAANEHNLTPNDLAKALADALKDLPKNTTIANLETNITNAINGSAAQMLTEEQVANVLKALVPTTVTATDKANAEELFTTLVSGSTIILGDGVTGDLEFEISDTETKTIIIANNSATAYAGTVTITGARATVYLLGDFANVVAEKVDTNSLHILGKVTSLTVNQGRAVVESGAEVENLKAAPSTNSTVIVVVETNAKANNLETEYQEHGFVDGNRDYILVENNGYVGTTNLTASEALQANAAVHTTTNVEFKNNNPSKRISSNDMNITNLTNDTTLKIDNTSGYVDNSAVVLLSSDFADGDGSEDAPFLIVDYDTFQKVSEYYDKGYYYFKVKDGIKYIDCSNWVPVTMNGSFNGNGVKLTNVTACLFQTVGYKLNVDNITIKDFEATMNVSSNGQYGAAALIKNIFNGGTTTFDNVKVHGYLEGFWNMGSFFNYGTANYDDVGCDYEVIFNNCSSDATLVCASGNTIGGLFGHSYEGTGNSFTVRINNTEYVGHMFVTTNSGNGNKYFAMTSDYYNANNHFYFDGVEDTFNNGSSKNAGAYTNSTKIKNVVATKGLNGYVVEKQENVTRIVATITAQLTAYNNNNEQIANLSGITMTLSSMELTTLEGSSIKVLDLFDSVVVNKNALGYSSGVIEDALNINLISGENYKSGVIRIQVNQYDSDGTIVSAGTLDIANCANATSEWVIK